MPAPVIPMYRHERIPEYEHATKVASAYLRGEDPTALCVKIARECNLDYGGIERMATLANREMVLGLQKLAAQGLIDPHTVPAVIKISSVLDGLSEAPGTITIMRQPDMTSVPGMTSELARVNGASVGRILGLGEDTSEVEEDETPESRLRALEHQFYEMKRILNAKKMELAQALESTRGCNDRYVLIIRRAISQHTPIDPLLSLPAQPVVRQVLKVAHDNGIRLERMPPGQRFEIDRESELYKVAHQLEGLNVVCETLDAQVNEIQLQMRGLDGEMRKTAAMVRRR